MYHFTQLNLIQFAPRYLQNKSTGYHYEHSEGVFAADMIGSGEYNSKDLLNEHGY